MPQSAVHGLCSTPTDTRASVDGKGASESRSWGGSRFPPLRSHMLYTSLTQTQLSSLCKSEGLWTQSESLSVSASFTSTLNLYSWSHPM